MNNRWKDQDRFFDPEKPGNGNCMQAAVASLLGLELRDVPHFAEGGDVAACWEKMDAFFESKGFYLSMKPGNWIPPVLYLASGPVSRGCQHMVIMKEGKLVHDPHPSKEGLLKVDMVHVPLAIDPKDNPLMSGRRMLSDNPTSGDFLRALKGLGEKSGHHRSSTGKVTQFGWLQAPQTWIYFPVEFSTDDLRVTALGGEVSSVCKYGFYVESTSTGAFWIAEKANETS